MQRLPYDADTTDEVIQYYTVRAIQLAAHGYVWSRSLFEMANGVYKTQFFRDGETYDSFFVLKRRRGTGAAGRAIQELENPIVTIDDCHIVEFLKKHNVKHEVVKGVFDSFEYKKIEEVYGDQRAKRSGVFLMNHIDEGIVILARIGASIQAQKAFCLHPLLQNDEDMAKHFDFVCRKADPIALAMAIEYRYHANNWLSDKVERVFHERQWDDKGMIVFNGRPTYGPLYGVKRMLIADKIQNYKDFLLYHKGSHPRSDELAVYFKCWFNALGVDNFDEWDKLLNEINPPNYETIKDDNEPNHPT